MDDITNTPNSEKIVVLLYINCTGFTFVIEINPNKEIPERKNIGFRLPMPKISDKLKLMYGKSFQFHGIKTVIYLDPAMDNHIKELGELMGSDILVCGFSNLGSNF
ncbi:MAG: hypothetical protein KAU06_04750 [Candidatus Marinimicrobia bacterium]|nr:hypothetical protein [Candidatus Neomarinimicrobiota bacterium]